MVLHINTKACEALLSGKAIASFTEVCEKGPETELQSPIIFFQSSQIHRAQNLSVQPSITCSRDPSMASCHSSRHSLAHRTSIRRIPSCAVEGISKHRPTYSNTVRSLFHKIAQQTTRGMRIGINFYTPFISIICYGIIALILLVMAIMMQVATNQLQFVEVDATNWRATDQPTFTPNKNMKPPIYVSMLIDGFYITHRSVVQDGPKYIYPDMKCREVVTYDDAKKIRTINGVNTLPELDNKTGKAVPCGLASVTLFNTFFSLSDSQTNQPLSQKPAVGNPYDLTLFLKKTSEVDHTKEWVQLETAIFRNWLHGAFTPKFTFNLMTIHEELKPNQNYKITFSPGMWPAKDWKTKLTMVVTELSFMGGRNLPLFLICLVTGLAFLGAAILTWFLNRNQAKLMNLGYTSQYYTPNLSSANDERETSLSYKRHLQEPLLSSTTPLANSNTNVNQNCEANQVADSGVPQVEKNSSRELVASEPSQEQEAGEKKDSSEMAEPIQTEQHPIDEIKNEEEPLPVQETNNELKQLTPDNSSYFENKENLNEASGSIPRRHQTNFFDSPYSSVK